VIGLLLRLVLLAEHWGYKSLSQSAGTAQRQVFHLVIDYIALAIKFKLAAGFQERFELLPPALHPRFYPRH
jgi:hypothetical protein